MKIPYVKAISNAIENYSYQAKEGHLPRELIYFVTTRCGYKCRTCFYWQELNTIKNELSLEEIKKISASMDDLQRVLFSGGEPYLRLDLPEICKIFHDQNNCKRFHIPTHGFNPDHIEGLAEKVLINCPRTTVNFGLSIDGFEKTHESISQIPGSFEKILETGRRLCALNKKYPNSSVSVICCVSNANKGEILELAKFIQKELPTAGFMPTPIRGEPLAPELQPPTGAEWMAFTDELEKVVDQSRDKNLDFPLDRYFSRSRRRFLDKVTAGIIDTDKQPVPCKAGDTIGVMEPDGRIKLCELKLAIDVGNVRDVDYDFRKVWFSDKANEVREKVKSCSCYHGCFLGPSLYYSPLHLVRSLIQV